LSIVRSYCKSSISVTRISRKKGDDVMDQDQVQEISISTVTYYPE